jgi:hypothetical protein
MSYDDNPANNCRRKVTIFEKIKKESGIKNIGRLNCNNIA